MTPMLLAPWAIDRWKQLLAETIDPDRVEIRNGLDMRSGTAVTGGVGIIPVNGPIDYRASFLSDIGFVASSEAIRQDFGRLMADPSVEWIVFDIDSPGGLYSGLPELARDVFAARGTKPTIAVANPMAASGALWLGAAAEKFVALGSGSVGSLGALMLHQDASVMFSNAGIENTILRSPEGKADFNPMEPLSEASRDHHQATVDAIATEFVAAMAKFRGVTKKAAADNFGQGRMLDAKAALSAGLIDGIVGSVGEAIGRPKAKRKLPARVQMAKIISQSRRASHAT